MKNLDKDDSKNEINANNITDKYYLYFDVDENDNVSLVINKLKSYVLLSNLNSIVPTSKFLSFKLLKTDRFKHKGRFLL